MFASERVSAPVGLVSPGLPERLVVPDPGEDCLRGRCNRQRAQVRCRGRKWDQEVSGDSQSTRAVEGRGLRRRTRMARAGHRILLGPDVSGCFFDVVDDVFRDGQAGGGRRRRGVSDAGDVAHVLDDEVVDQ